MEFCNCVYINQRIRTIDLGIQYPKKPSLDILYLEMYHLPKRLRSAKKEPDVCMIVRIAGGMLCKVGAFRVINPATQ